MEEKHECRICEKRFLNGRALGGHMRSHMLNHPLPSSQPDLFQSETESPKKATRKRSTLNRRRSIKIRPKASQQVSESCTDDQEPVSSVSDADEDVAFSLMMLSRDKWEKEEEESDENEMKKTKKKEWFECETCGKVFNSYQALGGHRASHKKKRSLDQGCSSSSSCIIVVSEEKKKKKKKKKKRINSSNSEGHECPICLKVFSSGQALGGHKRCHSNSCPKKRSFIDLNLPAPPEEDDQDLVSCVFNG